MSVRQLLDLGDGSLNYGKIDPAYLPTVTTVDIPTQIHSEIFLLNSQINNTSFNSAGVTQNYNVNFPAGAAYSSIYSTITINFNPLIVNFSNSYFQVNPPNVLQVELYLDNNGTSNNYKFTSNTNPILCNLYINDPLTRQYRGSVTYIDYFDYAALSSIGQNLVMSIVDPLYTIQMTAGHNLYPFVPGDTITSDNANSYASLCVTFTPSYFRTF